ncbi:MAG: PPE domain-containing protein, partial [Pseudonocardiaceae bacterium]
MSGVWDELAGLVGLGGPSGNDHGSSNWAAWGHEEIRSMLDQSVDPGDIGHTAAAWRQLGQDATDLVTHRTGDLQQIVTGGWRGSSADAATAALPPISQWSDTMASTAQRTTALMEDSGSAAAQAKAAVPPPRSHNWGESLLSFAAGGPAGALVDGVMQEHEQSEAHAEAVRVMTTMYSAPINDHRAAVPTYPQLTDPTQPVADQAPASGPAPGTLYSAPGAAAAGSGVPGGRHAALPPPSAAALQSVTSGDGAGPMPQAGGQVMPNQVTRGSQHVGGQAAAAAVAAAAGVPIAAPIAAAAARRVRGPGGGLSP